MALAIISHLKPKDVSIFNKVSTVGEVDKLSPFTI